ncbi:hypothetical protein HA466_0268640 [Hirschfeldia incana]|nr:hypothetical protein HA466_0268640 [Hirschfeldia incana]
MSLPKRLQMSFYSHSPDCKRQLYPHHPPNDYLGVACEDCPGSFCPVCKNNVHFPVSCVDMIKWKNREDLGPKHFQVYNECHDAWKRIDTMQISFDTKKLSLTDHEITRLTSDIFWELRCALQLLRWSWVIYWKFRTRLICFNSLHRLEDGVKSLLSDAPSYGGLTPLSELERRLDHPSVWGTRDRVSDAAVYVLMNVSVLMPEDDIIEDIERWKRTPPPRIVPELPESPPPPPEPETEPETESTPSPLCFIL